ncbi:MAG: ATP-dependent zinc protease [Leptospiraceae bacterium]|nr:ATP-dependent zinc protease [Leptospiraceae bacterium]
MSIVSPLHWRWIQLPAFQKAFRSRRSPCFWLPPIALIAILFAVAALPARPPAQRKVIGRVEYIEIPQWRLRIEARIDTGARSCSLHVTNEKLFTEKNIQYVSFDTEDSKGNRYHIRTRVYKRSYIRGSSGEGAWRTIIREKVRLGKQERIVNISLNDRSQLKYNFLIGRNLLIGNFIVDVATSHQLGD